MYIMINDIIGEKTIDLSYPIYPEKEIAVVSIFSNNSQILFQKSIYGIVALHRQENCVE